MSKRVSILASYPSFDEVAQHYSDSVQSMHLYYSNRNPRFSTRFQFYTMDEVEGERIDRLSETESSSTMALFASIDALFHVDYLQRCYRRMRDPLSRAYRDLYARRHKKVSLEDDLLEMWKIHSNVPRPLVGEIKGAIKYRHWLAHGRYWLPKLGRNYDFMTVYDLACTINESFPLERP